MLDRSELRHLDPLLAMLGARGNAMVDGGFVPSPGGPVCYFERPLDRSVVVQFLASDRSLSYDEATDTVHCRHCWGAITGGHA